MFFHPRSRNRPFHRGPLALETLPRDEAMIAAERHRARPAHAGYIQKSCFPHKLPRFAGEPTRNIASSYFWVIAHPL
jgi:hypothetical protein